MYIRQNERKKNVIEHNTIILFSSFIDFERGRYNMNI